MTAGQLGANRLGTPHHVVRVSHRAVIGSFVVVISLVLVVAVAGLLAASRPVAVRVDPFTAQTPSLVQFRAAERMPLTTEQQSLVQFRAGERETVTTEAESLIQFRAGERDR